MCGGEGGGVSVLTWEYLSSLLHLLEYTLDVFCHLALVFFLKTALSLDSPQRPVAMGDPTRDNIALSITEPLQLLHHVQVAVRGEHSVIESAKLTTRVKMAPLRWEARRDRRWVTRSPEAAKAGHAALPLLQKALHRHPGSEDEAQQSSSSHEQLYSPLHSEEGRGSSTVAAANTPLVALRYWPW